MPAITSALQEPIFYIPRELWNFVVKPLPSVDSACTTPECAVPLSVILMYAALLIGVALLVSIIRDWRSNMKSSSGSDSDDNDPDTPDVSIPDDSPIQRLPDPIAKLAVKFTGNNGTSESDSDADEEDQSTKDPAITASEEEQEDPLDANVPTVEELHQQQIASSGINDSWRSTQTGQYHRRIMVADPGKMEDEISVGGLLKFFSDPTNQFDMKVRVKPIDPEKAKKEAQERTEGLQDSASIFSQEGQDQFMAEDFIEEAQKTAALEEDFDNSRPFKVAIYVSARAKSKEQLENVVENIRRQFRRDANIELVTLEGEQNRGSVATSPIADDPFSNMETWHNFWFVTTARGVATLLSSSTESTVVESDGQFWGTHALNGTPIIKNPFNSPKNYNMTVIGESGTGKSLYQKYLGASAEVLFDDTKLIVLDPLGGFTGLAEAFDINPITVSGTQTINPLEIEKPPEEVINSAEWSDDRDPLGMKISEVKSFAQNLAAENNITLDEELPIFERIILEVYEDAEITRDVRTHGNKSPTFKDVFEKIDEIAVDVEDWMDGIAMGAETETIERHLSTLKNVFRPLKHGKYENLVGETEVKISDEDMVYLSMEQQDTGSGGSAGVMGQILFSRIYEHAKTTPKNVIFVIDEARFLFRDADSLEFLTQRVRQSRHHNMSIRFITQEIQDFFSYDGAEGIVKNSTFKIIHNIPRSTAKEFQDILGLKDAHIDFIVDMNTGGPNEDYSEALVQMPMEGGEIKWIPVMISPNETQMAIIDFDGDEDSRADLPGVSDQISQSAIVRELRARMRTGETSHEAALDSALEEWQKPIVKFLSDEDISLILDRVAEGVDIQTALREQAIERLKWVAGETAGPTTANEVKELFEENIPQIEENA